MGAMPEHLGWNGKPDYLAADTVHGGKLPPIATHLESAPEWTNSGNLVVAEAHLKPDRRSRLSGLEGSVCAPSSGTGVAEDAALLVGSSEDTALPPEVRLA